MMNQIYAMHFLHYPGWAGAEQEIELNKTMKHDESHIYNNRITVQYSMLCIFCIIPGELSSILSLYQTDNVSSQS